ncbi:hypothetical protein LguiA_013959 [Lonicera macranthoides]
MMENMKHAASSTEKFNGNQTNIQLLLFFNCYQDTQKSFRHVLRACICLNI